MSVGSNVASIFDIKVAKLFAYAKLLAEEMAQEGFTRQAGNEFWDNETEQAWKELFADAFMDNDSVGFFYAHKKDYGVFLELANDRQNAILVPMIEKYALKFKLYAQELFGASA